ncbi:hypothetical protein GCM10017083_03710 [Thalassobaculum fulvum]|jgi:hypothetical protein|uniref:Uncharacterized protein n=1 Tax=Thalassobaculum fulvum TaxID=1633335 RepID=A0A918XMX4_9PROT|nr:DUF6134 family protein [Thalassobaculum fulvum]GHD40438.1 hypothetical protein GCM10017083_03710 [Thalassobaculum fulvum]
MSVTSRRSFVGGLACFGGLSLGGVRPAAAGIELVAAYPEILKFAVTRDGAPLGVVMERFGHDGVGATAEVFIDFKVTFAGLALYRYEHRSHERWRDGRLFALDSVTNDNGTGQAVSARARRDGLHVEGTDGRLVAPADVLPSSYWHPRFVEQNRMLDSQRGRILDFEIAEVGPETVTALGRPVDCTRYAMRGDIDLDFWYDARRVWQKMSFTIKGSFIEYTRVAPGPADHARFGAPLRDGRRVPVA